MNTKWNKEGGSSQASKAAKALPEPELKADDGGRLLSPEEHRQLKIMEALNEAAKNKRLREEYEEHRRAERRFKA